MQIKDTEIININNLNALNKTTFLQNGGSVSIKKETETEEMSVDERLLIAAEIGNIEECNRLILMGANINFIKKIYRNYNNVYINQLYTDLILNNSQILLMICINSSSSRVSAPVNWCK